MKKKKKQVPVSDLSILAPLQVKNKDILNGWPSIYKIQFTERNHTKGMVLFEIIR